MTSLTELNKRNSNMSDTGVIFNIQRFSLHDGPGMRTVLFLKGCPLSCLWCSNPESQNPDEELLYYRNKCILCGSCVKAAGGNELAASGISLSEDGIVFDREKLDVAAAAETCPTGALEIIGRKTSAEEIMPMLMRDITYFRRSGGGITLSGGEPTIQTGFCRELLLRLRELGVNTAVETCGYRKWDPFLRAIEPADLILYDLKAADSEVHKSGTGVGNEIILENFLKLVPVKNLTARIPVIPGFNATDENFKQTAAFILNSGFKGEVHLLPYHSYGSGKYKAMQQEYQLAGTEPPTEEQLKKWAYEFESGGLTVKIHKH